MRDRPSRHLPVPVAAIALLAFLVACGPPPGAEAPISAAAQAAAPARLIETARFDDALAAAGPDAERLGAGASDLAARAAALRARAAAMSGPLIDPATHERLETAVSSRN